MDREKLSRIDTNVQELAAEFRSFISSEGPFVAVRERVSMLERGLGVLKGEVDDTKKDTRGLVVKVAGATAVISLGGVILLLKLLGVISG